MSAITTITEAPTAPVSTTKAVVFPTVFVPVSFGAVGKNAKDLFKKRYESELKTSFVASKKELGVTTEVGVKQESGNAKPLVGFFKETVKQPKFVLEGEVLCDQGAADSKLTVSSSKLLQGLNVQAKALSKSDEKALSGPLFAAEATYQREYLNVGAELKTNFQAHKIKAVSSVGVNGVSVATSVSSDVSGDQFSLSDYNLAVEYARAGDVFSFWTEKQMDVANLAFWRRTGASLALGAQFNLQLGGSYQQKLIVGAEKLLSKSTNVKLKGEFPSKQVSLSIYHRLQNPAVAYNFSAAFNAANLNKGLGATNFGMGFTFGDI